MTVFDYVILAIVLGSVVIGLMRGLITEVLSLCSWLIAFWCAKQFSPRVSEFVPQALSSQGLRLVAAFVLIFFLIWLATGLLRVVLTGLLDSAGLGAVNRFFGAAFGLARGVIIVTILALIGGLSDLPRQPAWRDALFAPPLESGALALRPWLPPMLANNIRYPVPG
jgi:membrane protein required for colicin V production